MKSDNSCFLGTMTEATSSTTTNMVVSSTPTELDLAFIIDATSSMTSYIRSAQEVCMITDDEYE